MTRDDLLAFARRDWDAIARSRLDYWAERYAREGSGPARQAASALHDHAIRIGTALQDDRHREADLASHLRVCDQLDRAGRALTGR